MAEAQLGTWFVEFDATVGISNELSQQESLTGGLLAAIQFAGTVLDIPEGVVDLPHMVELVGLEEILQISIHIEVSVLLEEPHLHQVIVEVLFIDNLLHDIGVLEDQLHQSAIAQSAGDIGVIGFLGLRGHIILTQFTVLVVHVPLVTLRGHHGDAQFGVYLLHLSHGDTHRLDTSGHDGADTTDVCVVAEDLWKAFHQSSGYPTVLDLAITRQFSPSTLSVAHDELHLVEHTIACGCQFVYTIGMGNHLEGNVVAAATTDIARSMTAVMREVERLLTFRRRRQVVGNAVRIGVIVT